MLYTWRDSSGLIQGAMEARIVNDDGSFNSHGPNLWIEQLEMNPGVSFMRLLQQMVRDYDTLLPHIRVIYWHRRDKTGTKLHAYNRDHFVRWAKRESTLCSC